MDVSPKQIVSVATAMIPFLEHDDANRALMGSNMMRQSVPLLQPEAPVVGTGVEFRAAFDSQGVLVSRGRAAPWSASPPTTSSSSATRATSATSTSSRSSCARNQGTCINQRPVVDVGDRVVEGQVLADG